MDSLRKELKDLTAIEEYIAAGDRRVADLIIQIEEMAGRGEDTTAADQTLRLFRDTLEAWREHRRMVLDDIAYDAVA